MNYKYRVEEKDFIVSPEEHETIKQAVQSGKTLIFLHNGAVAINVSFIRWVKETDDMTDTEAIQSAERLALPPEKRNNATFSGTYLGTIPTGGGFKKAIPGNDKDWKNCIDCTEAHFIPGEKERCLRCMFRFVNAEKEKAKRLF